MALIKDPEKREWYSRMLLYIGFVLFFIMYIYDSTIKSSDHFNFISKIEFIKSIQSPHDNKIIVDMREQQYKKYFSIKNTISLSVKEIIIQERKNKFDITIIIFDNNTDNVKKYATMLTGKGFKVYILKHGLNNFSKKELLSIKL